MSPAPGPRSELKAVLVAAIGSITVGLTPYLVRLVQTEGLDTRSLLFWRYVFGLTVLIPLAMPKLHRLERGSGMALLGLWLSGMWGAMQSFAYYRSIETVATSIVVTIFFAYPIFTLLLDRYVLKVHVPRSTVIAIGAIFLGVGMTSLPQTRGGAVATEGLLLAASTPILYAIYITFSYGLTSKVPAFVAGALIYLGQLAVFGAMGFLAGLNSPSNMREWLLVFAIGTLGGALQIASFAYALPRLSGSGYAVIVSLELVTVILVGVLVIGERLEPVQILGVSLVIAGVLVDRLMRAWTKRTTPVRR